MKKKLIILLIVLAVISTFVLYDFYRASQVVIKVVNVEPSPAVADPTKPVTIHIKLTNKSGKAIKEHNLYGITLGGGSFKSYREKTDSMGNAVFTYYPYKLPSYQKVRDVEISIRDESNSIFVEVYPKTKYFIKMTSPTDKAVNGTTVDGYLN